MCEVLPPAAWRKSKNELLLDDSILSYSLKYCILCKNNAMLEYINH